jgi:DNA-directed RNA polymerase specialized sigma24 family protein
MALPGDDYDDDGSDGGREGTDASDPESLLMRKEEEDDDDRKTVRRNAGVFNRIDAILKGHPPAERKLFWMVFVEGWSIARAAARVGVSGNVEQKFQAMLATVRKEMGMEEEE